MEFRFKNHYINQTITRRYMANFSIFELSGNSEFEHSDARIDVNEKKIRFSLEENLHKDAAAVIADLIIERQFQKMESRKKFTQQNNAENGEEKW